MDATPKMEKLRTLNWYESVFGWHKPVASVIIFIKAFYLKVRRIRIISVLVSYGE